MKKRIGVVMTAIVFVLAALGTAYADYAFTPLNVPGAEYTWASGINDHGTIVGYYYGNKQSGFSLSGGNYTTLNVPGAVYSGASGINNVGTIVGFFLDRGTNDFHGFSLSGGNYTTFTVPGARDFFANGINDHGSIVGYYTNLPYVYGLYQGYVLSGGTYTALNYPGATSTELSGINNDGTIVGNYKDAMGNIYGFLATPVPEPTTMLLLGAGLVGLVGFRRKFKN